MTQLPVEALGFAWYRREDYPRIMEVMEDASALSGTYDAWLKRAEAGERAMRSEGHAVVRVTIVPNEFLAWCAQRGRRADSKARGAFAAEGAMRQVRDTL